MEMPISEVIDRYTILRLKIKHFPTSKELLNQFNIYKLEVDKCLADLGKDERRTAKSLIQRLYCINEIVWNLEANLSNIFEEGSSLAKAGRVAIKIRIHNGRRIQVKNKIGRLFNQEIFKELKIYHISADGCSHD